MRHEISVLGAALVCALTLATAVRAAPGELDSTFGAGGFAWIDGSDGYDRARGAALQSDGKFIVGLDNGVDLSIARLNQNGSLDTDFGANGIASIEGTASETAAVLAQPDGKLVAVGTLNGDFVAARFLSDGRVDTSFGTNGLARVSIGPGALASAALRQDDGKLVIGGSGDSGATLIRLDTAGALDPSFGAAGRAVFGSAGAARVTALTSQTDGKIVAAVAAIPNRMTALRLTRDGAMDSSFGHDGVAMVDLVPDPHGVATALVVQNDGKAVLGGYGCWIERCDTPSNAVIARLEADGSLDTTLGAGGQLVVTFDGTISVISSGGLAVQTDGTIVVAGETWIWDGGGWFLPPFDGFWARITPSGALASAAGGAGVTILDGGRDDQPSMVAMSGLVVVPDGSVASAVTTQPNEGGAHIAVARASPTSTYKGRLGMAGGFAGASERELARILVRRTGGTTGAVSVDYFTQSGTAQSGVDFTPAVGTLTWTDGDSGTREIGIAITGDVIIEPFEQFTVHLSNPSVGADLAMTVGTITIAGEDTAAELSSSASTGRGGGIGSSSAVDALLLLLALLASAYVSRAKKPEHELPKAARRSNARNDRSTAPTVKL